jgi:hypothetical protein
MRCFTYSPTPWYEEYTGWTLLWDIFWSLITCGWWLIWVAIRERRRHNRNRRMAVYMGGYPWYGF